MTEPRFTQGESIDTPTNRQYTVQRKAEAMGRPRVKPEDRVITPPRQIGRVKDADWDLLLEAVEVSGETKTAWMTSVLMREARKVLRKKEHADRN